MLSSAKIALYGLGCRWLWRGYAPCDKRVSVPLHVTQIPNKTGPEWNTDLHAERPQLVGLLFPVT